MTALVYSHTSLRLFRLCRAAKIASLLGIVLVLMNLTLLWTAVLARLLPGDVREAFGALSVFAGYQDFPNDFVSEPMRVLLATFIVSLTDLVRLYTLYYLWRYFGLCARSDALTLKAQTMLWRFALAFTIAAFISPFRRPLVWFAEVAGTPLYEQMRATFSLTDEHLLALFFGAGLLAIASILSEAVRVAQENREFV